MANLEEVTEYCLGEFDIIQHELSLFNNQVKGWFETHPRLIGCKPPLIHSVKHRLKDREHLRAKIQRKLIPDPESHNVEIEQTWVPENIFKSLTDLAGVRVLHLNQKQFELIHAEISRKIDSTDWVLYENPKAYTWDPDSAAYFESLGIETKVKDSHYTSVHYVIRPRRESPLACEIQVRTLFEEIWGEVDHTLNYPNPTENIACKEQLRVLAKVVGAGSRLVESIFNSVTAELMAANPPPQPQPTVERQENVVAVQPAPHEDPLPPTERPDPEPREEGEETPEVTHP
ncbi:TPA: RelA/SpoT domain-containing protein [Pseudomonas aeruginosa]|uniref:RelA/SpoT domain-containing protein n=1 Tax=Pseudomonas aeruginosa TaxID=287 RepID=UPI0009A4492A|nr:RelA/SpoT domain-containing protein [Pseudomonas aeruginosa]